MAAYIQPNVKRQKVIRNAVDVDYFPGIDRMEYNVNGSLTDTLSYRFYNSSERFNGKSMEEWLRFSVSFTHFKNNSFDDWIIPKNHYQKLFNDQSNTMENKKQCIKALFDFCSKLNIRYWTAYDTDLIPRTDDYEEHSSFCLEIVEYILALMQKSNIKPLWIAPDLYSHYRYSNGALTNQDPNVFIQACHQTKRTIEMCQKLGTDCFMIKPREFYQINFETDGQKELRTLAKFLKMTQEYKEKISYRGQMLITPYFRNEFKDSKPYFWDGMSCVAFLRCYNLEKYYKVCAKLEDHMRLVQNFAMLGGIQIDENHNNYDPMSITSSIKWIVNQNVHLHGGMNIRLKAARDFTDSKDVFNYYMNRIDELAKALRFIFKLNSEHVFTRRLQQHNSSYQSGIGAKILNGELTFEEADDIVRKNQQILSETVPSSRREHWSSVWQRYFQQESNTSYSALL